MKRIILFVALVGLGISVNAQSVKLQSAISDLRNKRLDKAKLNIDAASLHESTKEEAKVWFYKSAIYAEFAVTTNGKFKDLVTDVDPLQVAFEAAVKCTELDKTGEYAKGSKTDNTLNFKRVAALLYNKALDYYNEQDFNKSMEYFEMVPRVNKYFQDATSTDDAFSNAALTAQLLGDDESLRRIYTNAVASNVKTVTPYIGLCNFYRHDNDTANVTRLATRISRSFSKNYIALVAASDAYSWLGNIDKAREALNSALALNPENDTLLNTVGAGYEQIGDYDKAAEIYLTSLKIKPEQISANNHLGILYFNKAVDIFSEANEIPYTDQSGKADKLNEEANANLLKAIPYLETALKYQENYNSLLALRQIYARLGEGYEEKLQDVTKRVSAIEKGE